MSKCIELRELAEPWLEFARVDLEAAAACLARESVHGWAIAFHCQQAIEKALKGALVLNGVEPPRTHQLSRLHDGLAQIGCAPPLPCDALDALTPFAIDDKYPRLRVTPIDRLDAATFLPVAEAAVAWLADALSS